MLMHTAQLQKVSLRPCPVCCPPNPEPCCSSQRQDRTATAPVNLTEWPTQSAFLPLANERCTPEMELDHNHDMQNNPSRLNRTTSVRYEAHMLRCKGHNQTMANKRAMVCMCTPCHMSKPFCVIWNCQLPTAPVVSTMLAPFNAALVCNGSRD